MDHDLIIIGGGAGGLGVGGGGGSGELGPREGPAMEYLAARQASVTT